MNALLVSYDLNKAGQDYKKLFEFLKSEGKAFHYMKSVWMIETQLSVADFTSELKKHLDSNDKYVVADLTDAVFYFNSEPYKD